ncbi:MAG: signal recognition particle-docking protein FtsY [Anaerolineae bacterium]|nr:signal recognition particle-docking protein FtsY [Anaerolineae bacterium]
MFFRRPKEKEKVEESLQKTRQGGFFGRISELLGAGDLTLDTWDELEELLIRADIGAALANELVEDLRRAADNQGIRRVDRVKALLKDRLVAILEEPQRPHAEGDRLLTVVLVVGVNGSGKTTTIGKLARWHKDQGRKVMLAAGDTFRAAAIDQLRVWAERAGVEIIATTQGADPGAVVYDAVSAALARRMDILMIDTAGRLHTKFNLMKELEKVRAIANKQVHRAPHETLLVLDATTGQNGLTQAKVFGEATPLTGLILTKLDGTAKGGIAFAIVRELKVPIQFIGVGEKIDDLAVFNAREYVDALFEEPAPERA